MTLLPSLWLACAAAEPSSAPTDTPTPPLREEVAPAPWRSPAATWTVLGPDGKPHGAQASPARVLAPTTLPEGRAGTTPSAALGATAARTISWLHRHPTDVSHTPGLPGLSPDAREASLLMAAMAENARRLDGVDVWDDPAWVARTFDAARWTGDRAGSEGRVRLTKYLAYERDGAPSRTPERPIALYAAPADDALRLRYTRQDVVGGVYERGGASEGAAAPIAWVREDDLYRALLQGTIVLRYPDGSRHTFNVDVNNGIPYDRAQREQALQRRYWYFREVEGLYGYGPKDDRILVEPGATVAGDVQNFGVGTLFWIDTGKQLRVASLSDTGGAFEPNLGQLDWLAGTFPDDATFHAAVADLPDWVVAGILIAREVW
ncbi:MAG: hypothetical protein RLZZ383_2059 [Pseudomonadota bacterium]